MSLVQYSSSSEESDNEEEVKQTSRTTSGIIENKLKEESNASSISSFLPAPKNRQPPKREPRVLGEAIRKVAGASEVNPDNIVLEKSSRHVTSFIPSSLRNKQKSAPTSKQSSEQLLKTHISTPDNSTKEVPELEIFQQVKSKPKPIVSRTTKIEVRPLVEDDEDHEPQTIKDPKESVGTENSRKRLHEPDDSEIKEFNVNDFYTKNMELKDKGLLEENKKLHTVTHSKNQLSALLKNAKQDEEVLSERIEHKKRLKKERGNKYGW